MEHRWRTPPAVVALAAAVALSGCGARGDLLPVSLDSADPQPDASATDSDADAMPDVADDVSSDAPIEAPSVETGLTDSQPEAQTPTSARWALLRYTQNGHDKTAAVRVSPSGFGDLIEMPEYATYAWSHDGKLLAWIDSLNGASVATSSFEGATPSVPVELAGASRALYWSPTRPWLLIQDDDNGTSWKLVDLSGGQMAVRSFELNNIEGFEASATWAPDGSHVLLTGGGGLRWAYLLDASEPVLSPIQLNDLHDLALGYNCAWSLDSRWIACNGAVQSGNYVLEATYGIDTASPPYSPIRLTDFVPYGPRVGWGASGWLAMESNDLKNLDILRVDGSELPPPTSLVNDGPSIYWSASPDGTQLSYAGHCGNSGDGLCSVAFEGEALVGPNLLVNGNVRPLMWSPDSRHLTCVRSTPALTEMLLVDVDHAEPGNVSELISSPMPYFAAPTWSPDSRWLAHESDGGYGQSDTVVRDLATGSEPVLFPAAPQGIRTVVFADDSATVAAVRHNADPTAIQVRFLAGDTWTNTIDLPIPGAMMYFWWQPGAALPPPP